MRFCLPLLGGKLPIAEVGDIPTEHAVADFVVLGPRFVLMIKRPMTVRRQSEMEMFRDKSARMTRDTAEFQDIWPISSIAPC